MFLVREGVDDGDAGVVGVLFDDDLAEGADGHDVDVAVEDPGDILDGFAFAEADLLGSEVDGLATEVTHGNLETDTGTERRLFEEEREFLAFEELLGALLQLAGDIEQVGGFRGGDVGRGKEMPYVRVHRPSIGKVVAYVRAGAGSVK